MLSNYYKQFAGFFGTSALRDLANSGASNYVSYVVSESGYAADLQHGTWGELFASVYQMLCANYRCEYVYKNSVANQLLLERHNLSSSTLLSELRVGTSKADVVILNGTSSVYEIKTELDNFERLEGQLLSYLQMFDHVFVVTSQAQLSTVETITPESVGIIVLTEQCDLQTFREAASNKANVDNDCIFSSLRQTEYTAIIKQEFGYIPDVPNTLLFRECKELFSTLAPQRAHAAMVEALQSRNRNSYLHQLVERLPTSLKMSGFSSRLSKAEWQRFERVLSQRYVTP